MAIIGGKSCLAIRLSRTTGTRMLLPSAWLPSRKIMNGVGLLASYWAGTYTAQLCGVPG